MAKDWVEPNPDHPRDPETGEFTDKTGAGQTRDWAQRISDEITTGRHGMSQEDRDMLLEKIRQTSETVAGHMQQMHRGLQEHLAARTDPLFHSEMSDAVEQDATERARQTLREQALFAFDKPGNLKRQINELYDELDIDERESIDDYIDKLRMDEVHGPLDQAGLDYALSNHASFIFDSAIADPKALLEKLRYIEAHGRRRFQETIAVLEDLISFTEED